MEPNYLAYMLRLWRVGQGEGAVWRASMENPHTGQCHGFASLEALLAFLQDETGTCRTDPLLPRSSEDEPAGL
jgi:hypothetical protein